MSWKLVGAVCAVLGLTACPSGEKLPPDPGLGADPLGIGIGIGDGESAAKATADGLSDTDVWVVSPEELLTRNPYTEREDGRDLLVVVIVETGGKQGERSVGELRAYLAGPEKSRLSLLGKRAAELTSQEAIGLLGQPSVAKTGGDGITHLEWRFDGGKGKAPPLGAVLSFGHNANCFAVEIRRIVTL
jgi:hypothetical protein